MDSVAPLEVEPRLIIISLLAFLAFAAVLVGTIVSWSRGKLAVPVVVLTGLLLYGLAAQPTVAIVSAILLGALIISHSVRRPQLDTE